MEYFKIGNTDYSNIVNELKIGKKANYNAQTNAAGNTVVDYINTKRSIEVSIIPLPEEDAAPLLAAVDAFNVSLSFRNPITQAIEEGIGCIIPDNDIEYYTIQQGNVMLKAFSLKFTEL